MSPQFFRVLEALRFHDCKPRASGSGYAAHCPAHEDKNPSLTIAVGDQQPVVLKCQAGCSFEAICGALGLSTADICEDSAVRPGRREACAYDYHDESGAVLFQVVRFEPKDFRVRRPTADGGWEWTTKGTRRVPYRLPAVLETVANGGTVYVVEGEKDADAINGLEGSGFVATTNAGGAGKWRSEYDEVLRGARVVIIADRDEAGRKHAQDVLRHLLAVTASVEIREPGTGKDASDHLAAGLGLDELRPIDHSDRDRETRPAIELPRAVDLWSPEIVPARPEFAVANLIRRSGLHLAWAMPSGGKTWTLLTWCHEMIMSPPRGRLVGHPDLWINHRWKRVLWIATEEDAGTLRYKAEWISRGLGSPELDGTIMYLFAAQPGRRITLDDLPAIIDAEGPFDAAILDSLTGLRPKTVNGERVRWDVDNDAANEMCLRLRGLASERSIAIFLVHHTGRETSKGYRGPTDWWASADVMFGLVPEGDHIKIMVEKNRDGRRIRPFLLAPSWNEGAYCLEYHGPANTRAMTPTELRVFTFMQGKRVASSVEITDAGLGSRSAVHEAVKTLADKKLLVDTGHRAGSQGKAVVYRINTEPEEDASSASSGEEVDDE